MNILTMILMSFSATGLAMMAASFLSPYITHLTKNYFGVSSMWAYTIHLASSIALSAAVLILSKELSMENLINSAAIVAVLSQTIFRVWKEGSGLEITPPVVEPPNDEQPS